VAIFARAPLHGKVKTRLTPALTQEGAFGLHFNMLTDTIQTAWASAAEEVALYWSEDSVFRTLFKGTVRLQSGADLGERLANAFPELLGDGDRAVVIGSDCPDLTPALVREALAALADVDLVLGPARDGGYYLIGLRRPSPDLFVGIPWSTDQVLAQTL